MRLALLYTLAVGLCAQALPTGFVRGVLVESRTEPLSGEFSVRSAPDRVYRFRFDVRTWIEREHERIPGSALRPGELLEVVSDRYPGQRPISHYARMVQVVEKTRARPPVRTGVYRLYRSPVEPLLMPEEFTFSGSIVSLDESRMTLRTRWDGEKQIVLRPDTRCLEAGNEVGAASLHPNLRIFVRAGRNLDQEFEASQIIWGPILEPAAPRD